MSFRASLSTTDIQLLSVMSTILLAFIGYLVTYGNNIRLENRKAKLKFISDQLQYLYGPLFSLTQANQAAWDSFLSKWTRREKFFSNNPPPNKQELEHWRLWMIQVFIPLNDKIEEVIIENAHLIDQNTMPKPFQDFLAHVEVYKVVAKKWEVGDFSEHLAYIDYPEELPAVVKTKFEELKSKQMKLMGIRDLR